MIKNAAFMVQGWLGHSLRWLLVAGLALGLAGCKGMPAKGERAARKDLGTVGSKYRPEGRKPPLLALGTNSGLSDFLLYAVLNSPQVEAAYFDWAASVERITTARSLPDPQLTFQMDIQRIVTSVMPGFMVNFPGAGKLRAAAQVASEGSQAKYFVFESAVLQTAFAVRKAYYQLHLLDQKLEIEKRTLVLLSDLEQLARTQNEIGKGTLQDVLRAQIEQERLQTELRNLEDSRSSLLAQFKAALGMKADQPAPPLPRKFEAAKLEASSEQLLETGLARNPRLKAMEAEVRMAEAAIRMAEKARRPDSSLGLMADVKMNPLMFRPLGGTSLPVWRDKIAAQIHEAQALKRVSLARLSAEQIALAVDFAEKNYLYRAASRNLALVEEALLPKAQESLEVARTSYTSGKIDFFNLMDTWRTLLGFELLQVEAQIQRELALSELSLLVAGLPPADAPLLAEKKIFTGENGGNGGVKSEK